MFGRLDKESQIKLEMDIATRKLADLVLAAHREATVFKGDAMEFNINGWHPVEALDLLQETRHREEAIGLYADYVAAGHKLARYFLSDKKAMRKLNPKPENFIKKVFQRRNS